MHNEDMTSEWEQPATKGDLRSAVGQLRSEIRVEIASTRKDLAIEIVKTRAEVSGMGEKLAALITRIRSDLMRAVETAVFKAEKVDRDQIITHDRLDRLEGRVTTLEARRGRKT